MDVEENLNVDGVENNLELNEVIFADLHIHSRFSRACSNALNIENLVKWARIKGLGLLGTGDFSHPEWLEELKRELVGDEKGIYWYEDDVGKFPFILSHEISLIYTQDGKGHRVHLVYLVPSFEVVDKINDWLDSLGRRDYDGRPIFKVSCRDFVAKMMEIDRRIEVIPAHIWTPYFGVFGSKSGFDSLKEAFGDMVDNVHAIETGISSDPEMNVKIKELGERSIVSFSDAHSFWPWRLGREATIFKKSDEGDLSYDFIVNQIRENNFIGTIETDPAYGKYHFDGHAKCNFSCSFEKSNELNNKCPVCGGNLIIGVENRVEELSDNDSGKEKMFFRVLPLHEIISLSIGIGMNSKGCWKIYDKLIEAFKNEFNILLKVGKEELLKVVGDGKMVDLIMRNREGEIKVKEGYDGVYGVAVLDEENGVEDLKSNE